MKQVTILSGKGGTGKTTITASIVSLAHKSTKMVITDCDVDAPNLHILLKPKIIETQEFKGHKIPVRNEEKCIKCGMCEEHCHFNAIKNLEIDPVLCEGCGVCAYICPVKAIELKEAVLGYAYISTTKYGPMSHARLNPGEENSGKLVTLVRDNARRVAEEKNIELIINDGPPGIGCPVIASVSGVDLGLIVVEPTLSGIHDMVRALRLLDHFGIDSIVCVNKYSLNEENTREIAEFCSRNGVELAGMIPFDRRVTEAMVSGMPVVEYSPRSEVSKEIYKIWNTILEHLRM